MDRNQRQSKDNQSLNEHFFHHESDAQSLSEEELLAQKQKEIRILGHIPEEVSPSNRCPICRNDITGRAVTDTCSHAFCFNCLREWSRRNNRCPNCRTVFRNIFYNIQENGEHNTLPVTPQTLGPQPGGGYTPGMGFMYGFGFRRRTRRGKGRHTLTAEQKREHRRESRVRTAKGLGRSHRYQTARQTRLNRSIRRMRRSRTMRRTRRRRRRRRFH